MNKYASESSNGDYRTQGRYRPVSAPKLEGKVGGWLRHFTHSS